jgi:hypothetical protein
MELMIRTGLSENEITDSLFYSRNPTLPRQPLQPGTDLARQWQAIRDSEVRPALKASLRPGMVDPVLLATFFSQYEWDERVPPGVKETFLTRPPLLSMGKTLRDRLLWNWRAARPPVSLRRFYDLAVDVCGHAGTAALLCHNVAKAFAKGGQAIHWQGTGKEGEYTDGRTTYTARVVHPAGKLTWFNRDKGRVVTSIFYLVFSSKELGTDDPGDWYHYFVTATVAAHGAAAELRPPGDATREERGEEEDKRGGPLLEVTRAVYPVLVGDRLLDVEQQMSDPSQRGVPAYRGWALANVLSFLEGGYYGKSQAEVGRESGWHRQGAVFGIRRAGGAPSKAWPWYVPLAQSISNEDLLGGFSLMQKTAEVLDPSGQAYVAH